MTPTRTRRTHPLWIAAALTGVLAISSCALFNKGELVLARHVTIGQELLDLQKAQASGAITSAEFETLKAKILAMVDSIDVSHVQIHTD